MQKDDAKFIATIRSLNTENSDPIVLAPKRWRSNALELIHQLSHNVVVGTKVEPILDDITNAITSTFPITFACIETYRQGTIQFSAISSSEGTIGSEIPDYLGSVHSPNLMLEETLAGETLKRNSTMIVNDGLNTNYVLCLSIANPMKFYHFIGVPLVIDGETSGVLTIATKHNIIVDKETINWSETLAHHISALLTRDTISKKLQSHENYALNMLNALASPTMTCSKEGVILNFNSAFRSMFEDFHGRSLDTYSTNIINLFQNEHQSNSYVKKFKQNLDKLFQDKKLHLRQDILLTKPNFHCWFLATMSLMTDSETAVVMFVDISDRKLAQEQLEYEMLHDQATGLANRTLFQERLNTALRYNSKENLTSSVFALDVGRYAFIVESLGHDAADQIISLVAKRIESLTHPSDLIARIGSSEFAILIDHIRDAEQARDFCLLLIELFRAPFEILGQEIKLNPSVGIAITNKSAKNDADGILHDAHSAMNQARDSSILSYSFSNASRSTQAYKKLENERDLTYAITNDQLKVFYQPEYNLHTGMIIGLEALVRWEHPLLGTLTPDTFIPLAEECGLIDSLFRKVFSQVVKDAQLLYERGHKFTFWTNLSGKQIENSETRDFITNTVKDIKVPIEMIGIEITETAIMENSQKAEKTLMALKSLGVSLALDDFGTGYSSLAYLQRFKADMIKIDKTFIEHLSSDGPSMEIVSAIIAISHSLKIPVLAEGVENSKQVALLRELGCDRAQGFFYCRPANLEDLLGFIEN